MKKFIGQKFNQSSPFMKTCLLIMIAVGLFLCEDLFSLPAFVTTFLKHRILPQLRWCTFAGIIALCACGASFAIPAFPGAEGFGSETPGGRGGKIIKVTNLNPIGAGSLSWACNLDFPRIIVFEVSGTININPKIPQYGSASHLSLHHCLLSKHERRYPLFNADQGSIFCVFATVRGP